ncbi:MAG: HAD family hydrolase [Desulfarculaceae bacterium]
MNKQPKKAVFLDRDGTINHEVHYLSDPGQVRLLPGAGEALARLNQAGFTLVVVTNQSGLARGYFREEDLTKVHAELDRQLTLMGARIDAYYVCPHLAGAPVRSLAQVCDCRKPLPGLILRASREMGLDLRDSFMVGDRNRDVACGRAAGLTSILVQTGMDDGPPAHEGEVPDFVAKDLAQAADWILSRAGEGEAPE